MKVRQVCLILMVPFAKPYLQQSMRLGMRWLKLVEYQAGVSFADLFRKYSLAMRCHEGKSCMLLKYLCNSIRGLPNQCLINSYLPGQGIDAHSNVA